MSAFEGDESGTTRSCDGLGASSAAFGEEVPEASCAVGLVTSGGKLLPCQHGAAMSTGEAFSVPGLALEGHPTGGHDLLALGAFSGEFLLKASNAVDVSIVGDDERFAAHRHLAHRALEASEKYVSTYLLSCTKVRDRLF